MQFGIALPAVESRNDDAGVKSASTNMGALGFDVDRIERLARGHEQAVSLLAAETEIGTAFRQTNLANPLAVVGCENLHAVIAFSDPAGADPDIAFDVELCRLGSGTESRTGSAPE